jgi:hypothetical protein
MSTPQSLAAPWAAPSVLDQSRRPPDDAFVSYSHADLPRVRTLVADLGALRQAAWWDHRLTPGQDWWNEICSRIRGCRLFIFALSVASTRSEACRRELAYAEALNKPILPVLVGEDEPILVTSALARLQYADLRGAHRRSRAVLQQALDEVRELPARRPPVPEPSPPPAPIPDLGDLPDRVGAPYLAVDEQRRLFAALVGRLSDPLAFDTILRLLGDLARRRDLDRVLRRQVRALLRELEEDEKKRRLLLGVPFAAGALVDELRRTTRWRSLGGRAAIVIGGGAVVGVAASLAWVLWPDEDALAAAPTEVDLGTVTVGAEARPLTVAITNTSGDAIAVRGPAIDGALAPDARADGCVDAALASSQSCTVQVFFAPKTPGKRTGRLVVASDHGAVSIDLTGVGVAVGRITTDPPQVTFDPVHPGQSRSRIVTVRNTGSAAVNVGGARVTDSASGSISVHGCDAARLGPGESCPLEIDATPDKVGDWQADVEVLANGDAVATIVVRGTATGTPQLTASQTSLQFDRTVVGQTSAAQTVTIQNKGDGGTRINSATTGTNASDFVVAGCSETTLDPGGSCDLSVTFAPTAPGVRSADVTVHMSEGADLAIPLRATAVGAGVAKIDPAAVDFGDSRVGATSSTRRIVVTNAGEASLDVTGPIVSGDNAGDFSANGCEKIVLSAGRTCVVNVAMTPTALGSRSAVLQIGVGGGAAPTARLTGNGLAVADVTVAVRSGSPIVITVGNAGPDTATGVAVDVTATNAMLTSSKTCVVDPNTASVAHCQVGAVDAQASISVDLGVSVGPGGPGSVIATVHSSSSDPNSRNNTKTITIPAATTTTTTTIQAPYVVR